jgi:hypothetical protein
MGHILNGMRSCSQLPRNCRFASGEMSFQKIRLQNRPTMESVHNNTNKKKNKNKTRKKKKKS